MYLKLFKRTKLPWGRREITIFGFKFTYISNVKKNFEDLTNSLNLLASVSDISQLKPVGGKLRQKQLALKDFALKISKDLEQEQIHPFLIAGSLIGQQRHKGFIPWDDDLDFGLIRNEFEKFKINMKGRYKLADNFTIDVKNQNTFFKLMNKCMKENPNEIFFLELWNHCKLFKGTSLNDFIFLDFFPFDYISDSSNISDYIKLSQFSNKVAKRIRTTPKALSSLYEAMKESLVFQNNITTSKIYYGLDNMDSSKRKHIQYFEKEIVFPLKKEVFENDLFYVPNKPIGFLNTMLNSDFMQYPEDLGLSKHDSDIQFYLSKNN